MPAGNPDGGQWTEEAGIEGAVRYETHIVEANYTAEQQGQINDRHILSDASPDDAWVPGARYAGGTRRGGGSRGEPGGEEDTPAQGARLAIAEARWRDAMSLVRAVDSTWKPTPGVFETVEGEIETLEAQVREAHELFTEVTGIGARLVQRGGHHYVSRKLFESVPLREDTRKVFEDAASGPLSDPAVNLFSRPHREYNNAVGESFRAFLAERGIESKDVTPAQARDFLYEILRSNDPRIRNFNMRIFEQRSLHRKNIFGVEDSDDD